MELELADNEALETPASYVRDAYPKVQDQAFTDFTMPNSRLRGNQAGALSHIALQNIHWYPAGDFYSRPKFEVYQNAWSGAISQNTTWSGALYVYDTLTVTGNATLTIDSGTVVQFVDNAVLEVAPGGHLVANGSASEPIVFTSARQSPAPGNWRGIHLSGSANNASILDHVTVEYAETGLTIDNAYPTITNLTSRNNTTGAVVTTVFPGSNPGHLLFQSSTFQENTGAGFHIEDSFEQEPGAEHLVECTFTGNQTGLALIKASPTISQSVIKGNHQAGAFLLGSAAIFAGTDFVENEAVGIDAEYSKDFRLTEGTTISTSGNAPTITTGLRLYESAPVLDGAVLTENDLNGLLAYNSRAILQKTAIVNNGHPATYGPEQAEIRFMDAKSLPLMAEGHNDIIDNADPNSYLMYGEYDRAPGDPWKVVYNYWGTTDEGVIESRLYPDGDYAFRPFDTTPNTPAGDEVMHEAGEAFQAARTLETDGNLAAAQTAYEDIITTYPDSPEALASLDRIIILAKKTERPLSDLQAYLENLVNTHPSEAVRTVAKEYLGQLALTSKEYATAAAMYGSLYTTATTTADSVYALIDQGYVVQQATADSGTGLGKRSPAVARQAAFRPGTAQEFAVGKTQLLGVLDGHQSLAEVLRQLNASSTNAVPTAFTLGQNYPNPFNPTTTIRYGVPDAGPVRLVVYDLTGRRIVTLVKARQAAGTYTVTWDGQIATGVPVGSGVYFYRLTQGAQTASGKMVLIR